MRTVSLDNDGPQTSSLDAVDTALEKQTDEELAQLMYADLKRGGDRVVADKCLAMLMARYEHTTGQQLSKDEGIEYARGLYAAA